MAYVTIIIVFWGWGGGEGIPPYLGQYIVIPSMSSNSELKVV